MYHLRWPFPFRVHYALRKSGLTIRIWTRPRTFDILFICHFCWSFYFVHIVWYVNEGLLHCIDLWTRPQTSRWVVAGGTWLHCQRTGVAPGSCAFRALTHYRNSISNGIFHTLSYSSWKLGHPSQFKATHVGDLVTVITNARTGTMQSRDTVFPLTLYCRECLVPNLPNSRILCNVHITFKLSSTRVQMAHSFVRLRPIW